MTGLFLLEGACLSCSMVVGFFFGSLLRIGVA